MKDKVEERIAARFPGVTGVQMFKILCYNAYVGARPLRNSLSSLAVKMHMNTSELIRITDNLKELRYLNDTGIRNEWYLRTVFFMLDEFPQWEEQFRKLWDFRYQTREYVWNVAVLAHCGHIDEAIKLPRPNRSSRSGEVFDMVEVIAPLVEDGIMPELAYLLARTEFRSMVISVLQDALSKDSLSKELLNHLDGLTHGAPFFNASLFGKDEDTDIYDIIGAYGYFAFGPEANGLPFKPCDNDSLWSLASRAISEMYAGHTELAKDLFLRAMSLNNEKAEALNAFSDPVLSLFFGLCLSKYMQLVDGSQWQTASDIFYKFMSSGRMQYVHLNRPALILFSYISESGPDCTSMVLKEVRQMLDNDNCPYFRIMASMILGFYRIGEDEDFIEKYGPLDWIPSTRILCHEISPFKPVGRDLRSENRNAFGGDPILGGIHRKEDWEVMLHDLRTNIVGENQSSRRIAYFLDGTQLKNITVQRRLSDGRWTVGEPLSRASFMSGECPVMNEADRNVARALKEMPRLYGDEASELLPHMMGAGRVFTGEPFAGSYVPVEVELVRPHIEFKARGTRIHVDSNIVLEDDGRTVRQRSIQYIDGNRYYLVSLSGLQQMLLSRMLPTSELPLTALPQLKLLEEKLRDVIDVRSDLALAEAIPQLQGEDTIVVRITPEDNEYRVLIQSCPMPTGQERYAPGEGDPDIFDVENGFTKMVHRNLTAEYEVYNVLREELESKKIVFSDYQRATISTSEGLLHLLCFTHDHSEKYIVEWPEGQILKFRGSLKQSNVDIQVNSEMEWFKVQGKISLGAGRFLSIKELLASFREAGESEYIRVGDREYMKMSKALRKHISELETLSTGSSGDSLVVPQYRIGSLAEVLGDDGGLHADIDAGYTDLLDRMKSAYSMEPVLPEGLNATLRPYQREGYNWLVRMSSWGAGACLADDMGLGKTLQTLAFLLSRSSEGPSLVVAPKSVAPNWKAEAGKFTPSLSVTVLNDERNRKKAIEMAGPSDVLVTTYGMLVTQSEALCARQWNVICLDEAHQIKNRNTRTSEAAMSLNGSYRMILTGTPIQNHLGDLWNLFQFINPGMLGPWQGFLDSYIRCPEHEQKAKHEKLRSYTTPFILRRTKEEVLDDLPEKICYTHLVDLTNDEMLIYDRCRQDAEAMFSDEVKKKDKPQVKISFFEMLTRLRLIANAVQLAYPEWKKGSSKVGELMEMLGNITETPENRVLVFSQFTSVLDIVRIQLEKKGMEYLYLDGQTPMKDRTRAVKTFQEGGQQIFLISLKAGGLGLNLTAANYVILMDPWWNPAIENQATDRAHRLGQKRSITVIRMVSSQTIEEKILKLHEKKQGLADKMLEGTADSSSLSMDDILDLVSPYR